MKFPEFFALALSVVRASPTENETRDPERTTVYGIDVSSYQPNIDWTKVKANGIKFAYIKATEGTYYHNPEFREQYDGATNVGMIRGAYHFANPNSSSGAVQANFFVTGGGGWFSDGQILPGVLDIEYNPYGAECYGKSRSAMVAWIRDFSNRYYSHTKRYPVIYTTTDWWTTCTGNYGGFANNPLWIARYASSVGTLPAGWKHNTFWQYTDHGANPGDADVFNGDEAGLERFARGH